MSLLEAHGPILEAALRKTLVQALILIRRKGLLEPVGLLKTFFGLFRVPDKKLRDLLYGYIIADVTLVNKNGRNSKVGL